MNNKYVIDLNKIMDFVTHLKNNEKNNDTQITQMYSIDEPLDGEDISEQKLNLITKQVTENKYNGNDSLYNVRYDLVKLIINNLLDFSIDGDGVLIKDEEQMSFGQKLCLNTLINEGIIKIKQ